METAVLLLRILRPEQWIKNLLVFLPLLVGKSQSVEGFQQATIGFVLFSLTASVGYIVNDLLDRPVDREHPSKKNRPIASGSIGFWAASSLAICLLTITIGISFIKLNQASLIGLLAYLSLNLAYSLIIKQIPILDIVVLSCFYPMRLFVGAFSTEISLSTHLVSFVFFFSLILSVGKRYAERQLYEERRSENSAVQLRKSLEVIPMDFLNRLLHTASAVAVASFLMWISNENQFISTEPEKFASIIPLVYICLRILYFAENDLRILEFPERLVRKKDIFLSSAVLMLLIVL